MVNRAEPWEEGVAREDEQWLVYGDSLHESRDNGMLSESERWLGELGELVRKDKSCFALILRDRQPRGEADRPREYVRELEKRLRQGETKRLVREKREMENVLKRKGG